MRLDVRQLRTMGAGDRRQRTDLILHAAVDFVGRKLHFGAAEIVAIGKTRMGADGDSLRYRPGHALLHHQSAAGVPAASDIGRADQRQQCFVATVALFAEVGVKVDLMVSFSVSLILSFRFRGHGLLLFGRTQPVHRGFDLL